MALQSYIKDLVEGTSNVQIVNDNSSSNIGGDLSYLLLEDENRGEPSLASPTEAGSFHLRSSSSFRMEDDDDGESSSGGFSSPTRSSCHRVLRRPSSSDSSVLEDFRERQRMIRLSMSPGVAASPRHRKKPSPEQQKKGRSLQKNKGDDTFLRLKTKLDRVRLF